MTNFEKYTTTSFDFARYAAENFNETLEEVRAITSVAEISEFETMRRDVAGGEIFMVLITSTEPLLPVYEIARRNTEAALSIARHLIGCGRYQASADDRSKYEGGLVVLRALKILAITEPGLFEAEVLENLKNVRIDDLLCASQISAFTQLYWLISTDDGTDE